MATVVLKRLINVDEYYKVERFEEFEQQVKGSLNNMGAKISFLHESTGQLKNSLGEFQEAIGEFMTYVAEHVSDHEQRLSRIEKRIGF